jgi:alkanesulfonate monooxygenase SsuD/methylene tetrahydromethanopterin reductase-like flavin-dependent oxidoreductase (luciferase family)
VHIGYWGLGLTAEEQLELVPGGRAARLRLGLDGRGLRLRRRDDPRLARRADEKIKLGSAIFQMPGRSPAMTAMTAATLDQLSDGRMLLGIGSSGPQVAEGWHGQRFARSSSARASTSRSCAWRWRASGSSSTARRSSCRCPTGPGKALKLTIAPVQERIPIYLAAIGPKNTRSPARSPTAGSRRSSRPSTSASSAPLLEEGAARAGGGKLDDFDIAPTVNVFVDDDLEPRATRCARSSRSTSAGWARASRTSTTRSCSATASRTRRAEVQDLYLEGKKDEAAAALPGELIDAFTTQERVAQLRAIAELAA